MNEESTIIKEKEKYLLEMKLIFYPNNKCWYWKGEKAITQEKFEDLSLEELKEQVNSVINNLKKPE